jgi:putative tricarboxylic transport membrane protein
VRVAKGELALALLFVALGGLWIVRAATMPLWDGFAPASGFMPLWYGILLVALAGVIVANLWLGKAPPAAEQPIGKALVVLAALAAAIVGVPLVGFALSIFLLMLVLFVAVERLPLGRSMLVAAASSAVLYLVFRTWLGVPLPVGPLGL